MAFFAVLLIAVAACSDGGDDAAIEDSGDLANVIAFGAQNADGGGLYVVQPDGVDLRLLQQEEAAVSYPVWSPGGGRIAYAVGEGSAVSLRVFDVAAGSATTVSDTAVATGDGPPASWSADGARLVYTEQDGEERRLAVYDVGTAASAEFPRVAGADPAWSPGGAQIAFVRDVGLYLIAADGSGDSSLVIEAESPAGPRWSPLSDRILVTVGPADEPRLLLVDPVAGTGVDAGAGQLPAWSPDASQIALSALTDEGDSDLDLFVVAPDGGAGRTISAAVTRDVYATWSPDGGSVAYVSQADLQTAFICLVRLDPEQHDCLDLPGVVPTTPAWSPR